MAWACRSSPRASRPRNNSGSSPTRAATRCRAISSASRRRLPSISRWSAAPRRSHWRARSADTFLVMLFGWPRRKSVASPHYAVAMADYDLAIIGGGLNGVSIARDAAGRGLRVILLEQGDLGGAASSATARLVHGDLASLERRGWFRGR